MRSRFTAAIISGLLMTVVFNTAYSEAKDGGSMEDPDTRALLALPVDERHMVLVEMRNFVVAMQSILDGLARDDMDQVANAARTMGSGAANEIPPHVVAKLPETFKQLAGKVHTTFDAISMDAEALGDMGHTVGQLSELTKHCVACHAIYQVDRLR